MLLRDKIKLHYFLTTNTYYKNISKFNYLSIVRNILVD